MVSKSLLNKNAFVIIKDDVGAFFKDGEKIETKTLILEPRELSAL